MISLSLFSVEKGAKSKEKKKNKLPSALEDRLINRTGTLHSEHVTSPPHHHLQEWLKKTLVVAQELSLCCMLSC
jgi:hypothetical protein